MALLFISKCPRLPDEKDNRAKIVSCQAPHLVSVRVLHKQFNLCFFILKICLDGVGCMVEGRKLMVCGKKGKCRRCSRA